MKSFLKVVVSIFIVVVLVIVGGLFYLSRGLESGEALTISAVKLTELADGIYEGTYDGGRWSNQVNVEVKDHKIAKIEIADDVLFPKQVERDELFEKVVTEQKVDVDIIAGSTVTCKAYLKAIENALAR